MCTKERGNEIEAIRSCRQSRMSISDGGLTEKEIRGAYSYQDLLPEVGDRLMRVRILETSEGADVVFPGGWVNRDGDPLPMIIRKADGGYNYSTSDLACIIDRVERLGCDVFLYVVGTPQKLSLIHT